jgi:hypothetical protein
MNSLEQFYIQLYAHNKKTSTGANPKRIQPYIPVCLQPTELSHYRVTLTYIYSCLDTVRLVHQ